MKDQIPVAIQQLCSEQDVHLLWAIESGSRAWGFASPDSDWDGRFLYIHPREKYLSPWHPNEEIRLDLPGDLDFVGWELGKALRLLAKGNPPLLEWLQSPMIYGQAPGFREAIQDLALRSFCPYEALRVYLGTARTASEARKDDGTIRIKKFFYILRPVLAAYWVQQRNTLPPMTFHELLALIQDPDLLARIRHVEVLKEKAIEGEPYRPDPVLWDWTMARIEDCKMDLANRESPEPRDHKPYENFFRHALETWG